MTARAVRWLCLLIAGVAAGCGLAPSKESSPPTQTASGDSGLAAYLDTMNRLANSEPAQQADVFYEVERAYTSAPTTANTLRHAIALVTPGHPASNLAEGKKQLEQLLAIPERLVPAERNLAAFLVKDADTRLQLQADIRRLTATVDERVRNQANSDRRVQALQDEIARLKRALDEAQQKLDAVKSIEMRSIIERSTPPNTGREPPPRN
jgi:chromosome segregation ATPase